MPDALGLYEGVGQRKCNGAALHRDSAAFPWVEWLIKKDTGRQASNARMAVGVLALKLDKICVISAAHDAQLGHVSRNAGGGRGNNASRIRKRNPHDTRMENDALLGHISWKNRGTG